MSDNFQFAGDPQTPERRQCPRQQVLFSCIQLEDDNGGIVLDVSERGLSMQAVKGLTDDQLANIRFQLSESQPWIETRGRIAWISTSQKAAGVEFVGLPDEARDQIKQWISLELQVNESLEGIAFDEKTEPLKVVPARFEPENAIRFPETETTGRVPENPNPNSIPEDAGEVPRSVERVLQYSRLKGTSSDVAENGPGTTTPLFAWAELEARLNREINAHKRTSFSRSSGRLIGLTAVTVLVLSALFLLAYHLQESKHSQQHVEAIASPTAPGFSTDTSANPTTPPDNAIPPSRGIGFMLQVGAMTHKENADALAEILRRRYFPAFVSPPGTDRFYRVVVGPYRDADAAVTAKRELKGEGFESIRTPWEPLTEPAAH
jgi:hypothetical protein